MDPTQTYVVTSPAPAMKDRLLHTLSLPFAILLSALGMFLLFNPTSFNGYGHQGDLFPRWYGAVAAFSGTSPYSQEVSTGIQKTYYGHAVAPGEALDEQRFANPAFLVLFLWPLIRLDFFTVRIIATLAMIGMIIILPQLWLDTFEMKVTMRQRLTIPFLLLGLIPIVHALKLQQLTIPVAFLLALAFFFIRRNWLTLAGFLLACAAIKPQTIFLPTLFLFMWVVGGWRARWKLAVSFTVTLSVLCVVTNVIVPGWIPQFIGGLRAYPAYTDARSLLVFLLGSWGGTAVAAVVLLFFLVKAIGSRTSSATSFSFASATVLAFCAGNLCIPGLRDPYNQVLLLPAVFLLPGRLGALAIGKNAFFAALIFPTLVAGATHIWPISTSVIIATALMMTCIPPLCIDLATIAAELRWLRNGSGPAEVCTPGSTAATGA